MVILNIVHLVLDFLYIDEESCSFNFTYKKGYNRYWILQKRLFNIDGNGYICEKIRVIATTYRPLLGHDDLHYRTEPITLTPFECWTMIYTHKCGTKPMVCFESKCIFDDKPIVDYHLWKTIEFDIINCQFQFKQIKAENSSEPFKIKIFIEIVILKMNFA